MIALGKMTDKRGFTLLWNIQNYMPEMSNGLAAPFNKWFSIPEHRKHNNITDITLGLDSDPWEKKT